MALATQCPHCHTTFRVAHDQLKLRAGLVRCGACKQIFNGIENLLRPDDLEPPSTPAPVPPPQGSQPEPAPQALPPSETATANLPEAEKEASSPEESAHAPDEMPAEPAVSEEQGTQAAEDGDATPQDPLLRMTLMDFTHEQARPIRDESGKPVGRDEPDAVERAIDDLQSKPWRNKSESESLETDELDAADTAEYEEPSFVKQGRRKQRIGRLLRIVMSGGSVLLLIGVVAQGSYVFRDQIAAWFPQTKPVLAEACAYIGCRVGLPAQIEYVSIESSELQTISADSNIFTLTALLRNHGATEQAWPNIELTLNDSNDKPIARRVFVPRDYLSVIQEGQKGFAPKSEQPIKLFFEVSQLKPSGYRLYLFYP
ncbi:DUF3426 domain-containing protein [Noviherbaspirillum sp.]|uniref:DUF3426 domain-containing protein n=1 Tax=Noviherbaspirillum sp. TaxID=1926288 RepID=UPI002B48B7EE|nr:DUF3426 domain-containing protein [Noviherbaspirillum sp.]HJV83612.1 DUF3426 domain-containing protein [Noviherbaspirillum sp.]